MPLSDSNWATAVIVSGALLVLSLSQATLAQIYEPPRPYAMWDTWLFPHGDEYHLFFLQSEPGVTWNKIGRAVSKDLVHWTPLPSIPSKGPSGAWDEAPTLTGTTAKVGDKYVMFYGSATHGQPIGIMTSPDLKTWTKYPGNPILKITPPHYTGGDWRDMCTVFEPNEKRWHGYLCAQTGEPSPTLPKIADKTLVAWVYLANRTQRGGSVLTIDSGPNAMDPFDGIVFGERTPGKWMAGSEGFHRTPQDQSSHPDETAGPDELVQMAIVYKGKQIAIYRNAKPYAAYDVDKSSTFGNGSAVIMGLRHVGAGEQSGRFFAGAIEEARVYDVALDPSALAKLEPGKPSDPKPLGQWTFVNGSTADAMGTFPNGELHGGARVVDGKLYLDGNDGYCITPTKKPRPCVAHLVSKDLIEWEYLPPIFADPSFYDMEVPDYFELNGRHYLLFSSGRTRRNTSGRVDATGTWCVTGEHRDGPYHVGKAPLLLGCGHGRFDNYVGRTIPFEGGRLLYHHTAGGGPVTWGVPKIVRQSADGSLWLQYWPGVDKLVTRTVIDGAKGVPVDKARATGTWQPRSGGVMGKSEPGQKAVLWFADSPAAAMITCKVDAHPAKSIGLVWRWDGTRGAGLVLDAKGDIATVAKMAKAGDTPSPQTVDDYRGMELGRKPARLRILVRAHRVEVYVNDRWILGTSMPDMPAAGRIGLIVEDGSAAFDDLGVAEIEPLIIPKSAD